MSITAMDSWKAAGGFNEPEKERFSFRKPITLQEFYRVHLILKAIVEHQLGNLRVIPSKAKRLLAMAESELENESISATRYQWLELLDMAVTPFELRTYITEKMPEERDVQLLVRFLISKPSPSAADSEKVDWLLTYIFRVREEREQRQGGWYKDEITEIVGGDSAPPLSRRAEELLAELPPLLADINEAESFAKITESRITERGRELKSQFKKEFFHPLVLAAVVNYNLMLERKFQRLFLEASLRLPKTDELREAILSDPDSILKTDYRAAKSAFWQVGESEKQRKQEEEAERQRVLEQQRKQERAPAATYAGPSEGDDFEARLKNKGIDPRRQAQRLQERIKEMTSRFQKNPVFTSMPTGTGVMIFTEWELNALRQDQLKADDSFRAKIAREITSVLGIIVSIQEELRGYFETKGNENFWRPHCEALFYLLQEGSRHKEPLGAVIAECKQRGLLEKASQIARTMERLETALAKIRSLSEPPWLNEPLN